MLHLLVSGPQLVSSDHRATCRIFRLLGHILDLPVIGPHLGSAGSANISLSFRVFYKFNNFDSL